MSADPVAALAGRYLRLCEEMTAVRNELRRALANGEAGGPEPPDLRAQPGPRPMTPRRRGGKKPQRPGLMQAQAASAAQGEAAILAHLQSRPGSKTAELVEATKAKIPWGVDSGQAFRTD
jgi:hypothetical protein